MAIEIKGCPACAGIDPLMLVTTTFERRLPRMRGDRPAVRSCDVVSRMGCPACAGIDPCAPRRSSSRPWLPRMRGDRPRQWTTPQDTGSAAPHARGSTRAPWASASRRSGCPACAGIDPSPCDRRRTERWLPRMRGDRPAADALAMNCGQAAPHARGSTRTHTLESNETCGCPACAGIDPPRQRRCSRSGRLPRMRGDRPLCLSRQVHGSAAAPHARGSTPAWVYEERKRRGCPACAGIDPSRETPGRRGARLPRMRGDRPGLIAVASPDEWAAPHARGSTRGQFAVQVEQPGCPACAGIDPCNGG